MPEAKENFRAAETDLRDLVPNHSFDLELLKNEKNFARKERIEKLLALSEAQGDGEIIEKTEEILGDKKALLDLQETLSLPDCQAKCSLLAVLAEHHDIHRLQKSSVLDVFALLRDEKTKQVSSPMGYVHLTFGQYYNCPQELFIKTREFISEKQGHGLGLGLEYKIENFCREHNIWDIYNFSNSSSTGIFGHSKFIGGYVWARMGYGFSLTEYKDDILDTWRKDLSEFANNKNIDIVSDLEKADRPFEISQIMGLDQDKHIVPVGKMFLMSEMSWYGHRDLRYDSQSTADFVDYLKEKQRADLIKDFITELAKANRPDLIKKFFSDFMLAP